jgi:N-acetylneuraminate synthase
MIIAEIGINHNGDVELAKSMIKLAKESGADVVKFQKRNPDVCVPEHQKQTIKETPWGKMPYLSYKKRIEFGKKEFDDIDKFCKSIDIAWTASVWDLDSLEFMKQYDVPFIKIPSALMTDSILVEAAFRNFKKVVISTGMSTEDEIHQCVENRNNFVLLHCTSTYPTNPADENLSYIKSLQKNFIHRAEIGYSGHEQGIDATIVAYILGCRWIERHFTLSNDLWGTDQKASLEPKDFKRMTELFKKIDILLGKSEKIISPEEVSIREKLRPK